MTSKFNNLAALLMIPALAACNNGMEEVAHPFYLGKFEASGPTWLFRCPEGPNEGCANDSLPDGEVFSAGANKKFITFQLLDGYYYLERTPLETNGWGKESERITGPLDEAEFLKAMAVQRLPPLTIKP
jgi:hypothetical protein